MISRARVHARARKKGSIRNQLRPHNITHNMSDNAIFYVIEK
jgi:hypothetical protein